MQTARYERVCGWANRQTGKADRLTDKTSSEAKQTDRQADRQTGKADRQTGKADRETGKADTQTGKVDRQTDIQAGRHLSSSFFLFPSSFFLLFLVGGWVAGGVGGKSLALVVDVWLVGERVVHG